ncbi:MAG: SMP-30/gluconolactonase/LRE family protein [Caulobacterales bacterium]|nr:SMP-30/gluconolactonase/LRE family protein [Caulobacterales bacterium]
MSAAAAPEAVLRCGCELGEGPVWQAAGRALWFVDIKRHRIHRFDPQTGDSAAWTAPEPVGFVVPTASGGWIVGLKSGLHGFDPAGGGFELVAAVEDAALGNRLNDGFVDARGRLWFGSMHDAETAPSGALYRLDGEGLRRMDDGYCITNGPAMSPDGRTLYHTDTLQRRIYAFEVSESGELANRRVFAEIEAGAGYPDGPAVDADGCVWTGLFGGGGVRRYSPAGVLLRTVRLPVANVTKLAFGGEDLRTAYATTARKGLSPAELEAQPLAGALFAFAVDTPGLPQHAVAHG